MNYNIILQLARYSLFIGASVCIIYYLQLGFFPKNISINDSLVFIIFTIAFSLIYLLTVIIFSCCGIFIIRPLAFIFQKFIPDYSDNLAIEYRFLIPILSIIFIPILHILAESYYYIFYLTSLFCGICWYLYQNILHINEQKLFPTDVQKKVPVALLIVIALAPLITSLPASLDLFSKATVSLLNLSHESRTIHIKEPYSRLITSNRITGSKSILGKDYLCYEKVDILLDGLNGSTIINFPQNKLSLSIPNDYIIYAPYQIESNCKTNNP